VTRQAPRAPRYFFALLPDAATRTALRRTTADVVHGAGGQPIPPMDFHLTLAYVGPLAAAALETALAVARATPLRHHALVLDRLGYFPEPRALWIGPSAGADLLRDHAARLRAALVASGLPPDTQPFVPHVTLARRALAPTALAPPRPVAWAVRGYALLESGGTHYVTCAAFAAEPSPAAADPVGNQGQRNGN
jgi:2'-5' RNA ligase